jgi:hypothetical protein
MEVKLSSIMTSGIGSGDGKLVSIDGKISSSFVMSIANGSEGGFGGAGAGSLDVSSWLAVSVVVTVGCSLETSTSGCLASSCCASFMGDSKSDHESESVCP